MIVTDTIRDLEKKVPKDRPKLKDIAEMPYPLSVLAMRKFYVPKWGVPIADELKTFDVTIEWEVREEGSDTFKVEAEDEEEAESIAEELWEKKHKYDCDKEIVGVIAKESAQ